jgi:hypothetical protein
LIEWANKHGFAEKLISDLPDTLCFDVAERMAGVSDQGNGWWPEYGEQHHDPRRKPSGDEVRETLAALKQKWAMVVGAKLASSTRPIRFTGQKSRRLLVEANPAEIPVWGSWDSRSTHPAAFTEFRKRINSAIAPMEVDDISFVTNGWGINTAKHLDS